MTPTQKAMCAVIREGGLEGLSSCGKGPVAIDWLMVKENVYRPVISFELSASWIITLDGHTVTQQEYEEWAKQQN